MDTDQIVETLVDSVNDRMAKFEKRLERHVDQQIDALRQPAVNAHELFGGTPQNPNAAPSIRLGESLLTSRGFSFARLFGALSGSPYCNWQNCKVELSVDQQLQRYYLDAGFKFGGGRGRSVLVPFSIDSIPEDFENVQSAEYSRDDLKQMVKQSVGSMDPDRLKARLKQAGLPPRKVNQALSIFDDTGLGVFVHSETSGEIIELVRAREILSRMGAREITLPISGSLTLPKQTGAATGAMVGEASTITSSEPTSGKLVLTAKKGAALVIFPNELLRFASSDTEAFLRADLAAVLARLADTQFLSGPGGTNNVTGLLNLDDVVSKSAGTVGANGDTLQPNDLNGLLAAIEENDHEPDDDGFVWIMRGKLWRNVLNRRASAISSGDQEGPYLFAVNREDIRLGQPALLHGHPVIKSGSVPKNRSKGSASDLTVLFGGIPSNVVVGRIGVLEFTATDTGTANNINLLESDQAAVRAIEFFDVGLRHEDSFGRIDTVDMDLPSGAI